MKTLALLSLCASFLAAQIQESFAEHFSIRTGLPSNAIHAVSVSPEATLWVGGKRGLSSFNGISWQHIRLPEDLASQTVIEGGIAHTSDGTWVATQNGIARFSENEWRDTRTSILKNTELRVNRLVAANNILFLISEDMLYYRETGDAWKSRPLNSRLVTVLEGMSAPILVFEHKLEPMAEGQAPMVLDSRVERAAISKTGSIFAVQNGRLLVEIDRSAKRVSPLTLAEHDITSLHVSAEGALAVGTDRGLFRYNSGKLNRVTNETLRRAAITSIASFADPFTGVKSLYVGTYNGIFRLAENGLNRSTFPAEITSVLADKSGTFVGTNRGLFQQTPSQIQPIYGSTLSSQRILAQAASGGVHLVATISAIHKFEDTFKPHTFTQGDGVPTSRTLSIFNDGLTFYIVTRNNHIFALECDAISRIASASEHNPWQHAAFDPNGNRLFLANSETLSVAELGAKTITVQNNTSLPSQIQAIVWHNGQLLIAAGDGSLFAYNADSKSIVKLETPSGAVQAMASFGETLFLRRNRDISAFRLNETALTPLFQTNASDGIPPIETEHPIFLAGENGLFLTRGETLLTLPSQHTMPQEKLPPLALSITENKNDVHTVHFRLPTLYHADKILYSVSLSGNTVATALSGTHSLDLFNLAAGNYTVSVTAETSKGQKSSAFLGFAVHAPWYLTTLAKVLYSLLAAALIFVLVRLRVAALRKRNIQLEAVVEERLTEIKAQKEELEVQNKRLDTNAERLQKANKLKNEFLGMAAHDLKNPLSVISGFTDIILADKETLTDEHVDFLETIQRGSKQMFGLISELLENARNDETELTLTKTSTDLDELLTSLTSSYRAALETKELTLNYATNEKIEAIVDIDRMREIFDNLVSNAIKYSPLGKNIWISLTKDTSTGKIRFIVRDEGQGMTKEDLESAFGRFQRLSAQPTGGESSNGLGLSIVKRLVELHDGDVWIESEYGHGCAFHVEFLAG